MRKKIRRIGEKKKRVEQVGREEMERVEIEIRKKEKEKKRLRKKLQKK